MERVENQNELATELIMSSLRDDNGNIKESELRRFIQDTVNLRTSVSTVYSELTKGLLLNWDYPPDTVISVFNNLQKNLVNKDVVYEDIIHLVHDEPTKQLIEEYFGKLY